MLDRARDRLCLQAEEAFADPDCGRHRATASRSARRRMRQTSAAVCKTMSQPFKLSPSRPTSTSRSSSGIALTWCSTRRITCLAELDLQAPDNEAGWSLAILSLLETARLRLLLSGTLERAGGRVTLWLAYRCSARAGTRAIDPDAPAGPLSATAAPRRSPRRPSFRSPSRTGREAEWLDAARRRVGQRPRQAAGHGLRPGQCQALPRPAERLGPPRPGRAGEPHRHLRRTRCGAGAARCRPRGW
jgi:hypothetical protein